MNVVGQASSLSQAGCLMLLFTSQMETLYILSSWRTILEDKKSLTAQERELYMSLSTTYLRRQQQWLEEGLQQGQRQIVESLLRTRFEELDEQLAAIVPSILALSPQEYAALLLQLSQLSREDLLARFAESSPSA